MPILSSRGSWLVASGLLTLTLVGAGCGASERIIDTDTNTINLQNENGNGFSAGDNAQIPSTFPNYFPRYPNGTTRLAYSENQGKSSTLVQLTNDSFADARAFVEQSMQSQGFTKENTLESPDLVILGFTKVTTRCQVNIAHQAPTTQIQTTCVEQ